MQDKSHYTRYNYKKLYELAVEMFIRYGFSREDSEKVADVILTSDRFGVESHGVNRLTLYPFGIDIGRIKVDAKPEVVEDRLSMAVIDAHDGMGQLASIQGMQLAIDKAKKYGVGMVSVRNSNHFGIAGYYSMMAAKQGLMGVSMTNAEALVVPTYAREPMFGTNPIAVTIPADPHPFHMDFATSVMTCGKMEVYAKIGHELQPGMLVDETGTTCLDPNVFLRIRDTVAGLDAVERALAAHSLRNGALDVIDMAVVHLMTDADKFRDLVISQQLIKDIHALSSAVPRQSRGADFMQSITPLRG